MTVHSASSARSLPTATWRAPHRDCVDERSPALQRRIREHSKSIDEAANLEVSDFSCRYLAVVPVWITLAERFLIDYYKPVWNLCLDGFGDHDPGKGRRNSQRSWWDTLHPGRKWASGLGTDKKQEEAEQNVASFFAERSVGRCCMIQLRREWGRFSNFSFRTPQRRISAYPARPSG